MLRQLRVQNVRNHHDGIFEFSPTTTVIIGSNGIGKTSLLEAIYIAYRGASFRGSDKDIIRVESPWYRIDLKDEEFQRIVKFRTDHDTKQKSFTIDNKNFIRLPLKYKRPIVLFSPEDLQLLSGSPSRRRKYIDTILSQLDTKYASVLRRYERALHQRNKLLKLPGSKADTFFSWNIMLSEYGAYITASRKRLIEQMNELLTAKYQSIAQKQDVIDISYSHAAHTSHYLLAEYEKNFERDRLYGSTSTGPHRHDMIINMNDKYAADTASRGENRTIILSLKSIEADIITRIDQQPLILLDDVYGELDSDRQYSLKNVFDGFQTIITSTHDVQAADSTIITLN